MPHNLLIETEKQMEGSNSTPNIGREDKFLDLQGSEKLPNRSTSSFIANSKQMQR